MYPEPHSCCARFRSKRAGERPARTWARAHIEAAGFSASDTPRVGNRTSHRREEVPAERAGAGCSRCPRGVKRLAAQEVRSECAGVQAVFPFSGPGRPIPVAEKEDESAVLGLDSV